MSEKPTSPGGFVMCGLTGLLPGRPCVLHIDHGRDEKPVHKDQDGRTWWVSQTGTKTEITPHLSIEQAYQKAEQYRSAREQLAAWWRLSAEAEIDMVVDKAVEYGATDLIDIGVMLSRTMKRPVKDEGEAAELGCFFYLVGKFARWQSAIERGERASDDTILDMGVYIRMVQRIREVGSWPGTEEQ